MLFMLFSHFVANASPICPSHASYEKTKTLFLCNFSLFRVLQSLRALWIMCERCGVQRCCQHILNAIFISIMFVSSFLKPLKRRLRCVNVSSCPLCLFVCCFPFLSTVQESVGRVLIEPYVVDEKNVKIYARKGKKAFQNKRRKSRKRSL